MTSKKRVRSSQYPYYNLEKCINLVAGFYNQAGEAPVKPDRAKVLVGMSPTSSSGIRSLSTLELFGLLEQRKSYSSKEYAVTKTAVSLATSLSRGDKLDVEVLQQVALNPQVVRLVWERVPDNKHINEDDITQAIRKSPEITIGDSALSRVVANVRDTLIFAELSQYRKQTFSSTDLFDLNGDAVEDDVGKPGDESSKSENDVADPDLPEEDNKNETYDIAFRSGKVSISLPLSLTSGDADAVKAWINSILSEYA